MATAKTTKTAAKASPKPKVDLNQFLDEIKDRSYDIYLERQRSGAPGDEFSDWLQAEADVKKKHKIK